MSVPSAPAQTRSCAKAELAAMRPSRTMATPKVFISAIFLQLSYIQYSSGFYGPVQCAHEVYGTVGDDDPHRQVDRFKRNQL